jgi:hypothetical protein
MVLIQDFSAETPDFLPVCTHLGSLGMPRRPLFLLVICQVNRGFPEKPASAFSLRR